MAQSELVGNQLNSIIATFVKSHASLIVEGVHLSIDVILKLVQQFPNIIPFLIYIKKEDFHRQRFAVRAKYMTTDPSENRYISHFDAIRCVQNYLSEGASHHLLPKIDNRNIDRSMETMHQTIFSYLKKLEGRKSMYDESTQKLTFLDSVWKRRKQKMTSKSKSLKAINSLKKAQFEEMMMMAYKINREKTSTVPCEITDESETIKFKEFVQNFLNNSNETQNEIENSPDNLDLNIDLNGLNLNGINIDNLLIDNQLLEQSPLATMNHELENQKYYDELMEALPAEGKKITSQDIDGNFFQFLKNGSMLMMHDKQAAEKKRQEDEEAELLKNSPKSSSSKSIPTGFDIQLIPRHSSSPSIPPNNEMMNSGFSSESSTFQPWPNAFSSIDNSTELLLSEKGGPSTESPEMSDTSLQITNQMLQKKKPTNLVIVNDDGSFMEVKNDEKEMKQDEVIVKDETINEEKIIEKKEEMKIDVIKEEFVEHHEINISPEDITKGEIDHDNSTDQHISGDRPIVQNIDVNNKKNDVTFDFTSSPTATSPQHPTAFSFDENAVNGQSEYSDSQMHADEFEIGNTRKKLIGDSDRYNDMEFPDTETDLDPAEVTLTDFIETTDSEATDWKSMFARNTNPQLYANTLAELQRQIKNQQINTDGSAIEHQEEPGEKKNEDPAKSHDSRLIDPSNHKIDQS